MAAAPRTPTERMAACRRTTCAVGEVVPNAAIATYLRKRFTFFERNLLAVLVPRIQRDGRTINSESAAEVSVDDEPGALVAHFTLQDASVDLRLTPLLVGRDDAFEGAVCCEFRCSSADRLSIWIGTGSAMFAFDVALRLAEGSLPPSFAELLGLKGPQQAPAPPARVRFDGDTAWFRGGEDGFAVAVSADGAILSGHELIVSLPPGGGQLTVAYADDPARAVRLARSDTAVELARVREHYQRLLSHRIETPDPTLDAAFRSAAINLEYTWNPPYGWVECIHHWSALWHMQHSAGAEWLGQTGRARLCIDQHARNLLPGGKVEQSAGNEIGVPIRLRDPGTLPGGAVPQLTPAGHTHRDFGGSNQFWGWQVAHHWHFTGDAEFARRIAPALDKVLAHTLAECDPDGDGLLSWGLQIGNQEDYIATPGGGTTPTIEMIAMARTRAELARASGDCRTANKWDALGARMAARLRQRLWLPDLGRFAYLTEQEGHPRLEGQYHTFLYPAIHGLLDPLSRYTSVRHVLDRLVGSGGEVYCSNNFPNHVPGTWGMQTGAAQQPWAAWGFAAAGLWDRVWHPLHAAAEWAMSPNMRGSWPEVSADIPTPAYFSPPAGLFVAAVTEALFGLRMNRPARRLHVDPALPDAWHEASITVAGASAAYKRTGNRREYSVTTENLLARELRWPLPVGRPRRVLINGRPARYRLEAGVGHVVLAVDTRPLHRSVFTVEWEPCEITVRHEDWIAEGEELKVAVAGAEVQGIDDPCGVTSGMRSGDGSIIVRIRSGLLHSYQGFGPLGEMNFCRRTFFLRCRTRREVSHWHPINIVIVPPVQIESVGLALASRGGAKLQIRIRNNRDRPLRERGRLLIAGSPQDISLDLPLRSQVEYTISLPARVAGRLLPGANAASLTLVETEHSIPFDVRLTDRSLVDRWRRLASWSFRSVPLPAERLASDSDFISWRCYPTHWQPPWSGARAPLAALAGRKSFTMPGYPGIRFRLQGRKLLPVSMATRPRVAIPLPRASISKVVLVVVPLLDNHDIFAVVGRMSILTAGVVAATRLLHFPGDLDWWHSPAVVGEDFATARADRPGGLPLLPRLGGKSDYPEARPPYFPQPALWSRSPALVTESAVLCAIELELAEPFAADSVVLEAFGDQVAFGIVSAGIFTLSGDGIREKRSKGRR